MRATRIASYLKSCRRAQTSLRRIEEAVGHHHLKLMLREARTAAAFLGAEVRQFQEAAGTGAAAVLANLGKTVRRSLQTSFAVLRVLLKNSWMGEEVYEKRSPDGSKAEEVRVLTSTTAETAERAVDKLCRLFRKMAVWLQWTAAVKRREAAIDQMPSFTQLQAREKQQKLLDAAQTANANGDRAEDLTALRAARSEFASAAQRDRVANYGENGLAGSTSARPTNFRGEATGAAEVLHH